MPISSATETFPRTRETSNNRNAAVALIPHPDATPHVSLLTPRRDTERDTERDCMAAEIRDMFDTTQSMGHRRQVAATTDDSFHRLASADQAILSAVVGLRLLTFAQVHELLFRNYHPTLTRRRLRHLRDAGWLVFRDAVPHRGRRVRFALPTRRALTAVLPCLERATARERFAPLVQHMLPHSTARPLNFPDGTTPKWLPHQIEVNRLVTRIAASARRIRWASAWDAPFPSGGGIGSPQPDYVLVEEIAGTPLIVFGEHDRGTEPVERFFARKIEAYNDLAVFPERAEAQFGSTSFVVHVSVIDVRTHSPMHRLRALLEAASMSRHPELFRFTLGGWLFAHPADTVFFTTERPPARDSLHWSDHAARA